MKRFKLIVFLLLSITTAVNARIINVAVSSNTFTPSNITNAFVGDTIKWNWIDGFHTTTCDGQTFTSRPAGAPPWNATISSSTPTFMYVIQVAGTYNYICEPHAPSMAGVIVAGVSSISQVNEVANGYYLSQNYPNPFNPSTKIKFSIPEVSGVNLKIYDSNGREIETLVNERLNASVYEVDWNADNISAGVYYYRLSIYGDMKSFVETKKMLLIK